MNRIARPILLLDAPLVAIDDYMHDLGWNVVSVIESLGQGAPDDKIIELAREKHYIVVTPDRKLVKRCKLLNVDVVEVGLEDYAKKVHKTLVDQFHLQ